MKSLLRWSILLAALAMAASSAYAITGYVNQPPFTPQRTLFWTFTNSETWQTPITAAGPTWDSNTQEYGDWTCDDVTAIGETRWYDTNPNWAGHQGMLGLDNTQGTSGQTVSIKFHVNNYATQNRLKQFYTEAELITWGDVIGTTELAASNGYQVADAQQGQDQALNPGMRVDLLWNITPNPTWEEITWQAYVPAGAGVLIDNIFVSTACVPEPASLLALGTGFMGILGLATRCRRA